MEFLTMRPLKPGKAEAERLLERKIQDSRGVIFFVEVDLILSKLTGEEFPGARWRLARLKSLLEKQKLELALARFRRRLASGELF